MQFKTNLYRIRKEKGFSQERLAEEIGVSRQAVSRWETGDAQPELSKLISLAEALQVSLDELCGRTGANGDGDAEPLQENSINAKGLVQKFLEGKSLLLCLAMLLVGLMIGLLLPKGDVSLPENIVVQHANFTATEDGILRCEIIPSVNDERYQYKLVFVGSYTGEKVVFLNCRNGVYVHEEELPAGDTYTVSLVIGRGLQKRNVLVATNLNISYSEGSASWRPAE